MKDKFAIFIGIVGVISIFAIAFYIKTGVWRECRNANHSIIYCWSMVNR